MFILSRKLSCWQTKRRRWKHPTLFAALRRWVTTYVFISHGLRVISAVYWPKYCPWQGVPVFNSPPFVVNRWTLDCEVLSQNSKHPSIVWWCAISIYWTSEADRRSNRQTDRRSDRITIAKNAIDELSRLYVFSINIITVFRPCLTSCVTIASKCDFEAYSFVQLMW